ncbi:hypothetical protein K438DRAFT_2138011 [Mycena galopus ATCC 62051]|nr:hypothetical protein K438DRAFT_2138011 [Mycena galopus ATCC 62051]
MPHQPTVDGIRLQNIAAFLEFALPLLNDLNEGFGPPFNVKHNKSKCAQLMDNIHHILYAIVDLHMKSVTAGSLHPSMLNYLGGFIEYAVFASNRVVEKFTHRTLYKVYTFVETQQEGTKIKHLFHNNEMNIQTQTQALNDISDFKKTADLMHQKLVEVIDTFSETSTRPERSSIYLGPNESKNSSKSFSMLPSKPKIFHGREQELKHILKLLTEQSPRIAILGGGGMGKTSLARAALHNPDTLAKFQQRFFVNVKAATTSVELAALIGLHVGLNLGKDLTKLVVQPGVKEFLSLLAGLENLALIPLSNEAPRQTFIEITDNSNPIEGMDQLLGFKDNMPLAVDLITHPADYEGFDSSSMEASISRSLSNPRIASDNKELLSLLSVLPNGLSEAELVQVNSGIPNILSCKAAPPATSLVYRDNNQRWVVLMPIREYNQWILPPAESHLLLPQLLDQQLETMVLIESCWSRDYWTTVSEDMIAQEIIHLDHANNPDLGSKFYGAAAHHFFHYTGNPQQATQFYHKALEMAKLCGDRSQECAALMRLASLKWNTGNYHAASAFATAAQRLSELSTDLYWEASATYYAARCSISLGNYKNTPVQLNRALDLLHICGMSEGPKGTQILATLQAE